MKGENISFVSLLYIIGWCLSPPLAYGTIYRIIAIIAVFIVILCSIANNSPNLRQRLTTGILLCAYIILICLITGENYTGKIGTCVILLTSISFALWNYQLGENVFRLKILVYYSICLYCLWNTTTLIGVAADNYIMRALVRNSDISVYYAKRGVGGYGYLYSVIIMLPIGISLLKQRQKLLFRLATLYFVCSSVLLIYLSQYFMALILMILVIPMMYIAQKNKSGKNISSYILIIGILIIVFANLESILDYIISIVDIPSIHRKLVDMQNTLLYGGDVEDTEFGGRYERYTRDLNLILQSPIFGVFKYASVGKHSNILDFLAQYGIPIGIVYLNILFSSCRDWIKKRIPIASVVLWITLIIALMNQLPLSASVPLCVVLPSFCKVIWQKSQLSITPE